MSYCYVDLHVCFSNNSQCNFDSPTLATFRLQPYRWRKLHGLCKHQVPYYRTSIAKPCGKCPQNTVNGQKRQPIMKEMQKQCGYRDLRDQGNQNSITSKQNFDYNEQTNLDIAGMVLDMTEAGK